MALLWLARALLRIPGAYSSGSLMKRTLDDFCPTSSQTWVAKRLRRFDDEALSGRAARAMTVDAWDLQGLHELAREEGAVGIKEALDLQKRGPAYSLCATLKQVGQESATAQGVSMGASGKSASSKPSAEDVRERLLGVATLLSNGEMAQRPRTQEECVRSRKDLAADMATPKKKKEAMIFAMTPEKVTDGATRTCSQLTIISYLP